MTDLVDIAAAARHLPEHPRAVRAAFDRAHVVDGRTLVSGRDRFVILPTGHVWHVARRDGVLRAYLYAGGREVARTA
jgi:hypothetical protein